MKTKIYPIKFLRFFAGPILTLVMYIMTAFIIYWTVLDFLETAEIEAIVVFGCIFFIASCIFWQLLFVPRCFGVLTITDKFVKLSGFLVPPVKLYYDEIKSLEIRTFGDDAKLIYSINAFKYVILSKSPVKCKDLDFIFSSNRKKIIKFMQSEELCKALIDKLPRHLAGKLDYQLFLYQKHRL